MRVPRRSGDGLRWPELRLPRPTGIRNGGLLLVLVALATVVALVDEPPEVRATTPEVAAELPAG